MVSRQGSPSLQASPHSSLRSCARELRRLQTHKTLFQLALQRCNNSPCRLPANHSTPCVSRETGTGIQHHRVLITSPSCHVPAETRTTLLPLLKNAGLQGQKAEQPGRLSAYCSEALTHTGAYSPGSTATCMDRAGGGRPSYPTGIV